MVENQLLSNNESHAGRLIRDATLLTVATLLMKTVGVAFGVYVSNRAGAEAMGLYALLSGVYGFAMTLATSGIHLSVTRAVSESLGLHQEKRILPCMKHALLLSGILGLFAGLLLFLFAEPIGIHWLKDARTVASLKWLSLTVPFIALSSAMSGYFSAVRRVWKSALASISEQAVRIAGTVFFLTEAMSGDVESACLALVLGGNCGVFLSFLIEWFLYVIDRKAFSASADYRLGSSEGRKIVRTAAPIAISTYLRSGLVTVEHILIPEGLRKSGSSHGDALSAYGSIGSMALPILLYPASVIGSFAGLLIPEMTEASVKPGEKRIPYMIGRVLSLSLAYSVGVGGIICCFAPALGNLLYPGTATATYLRILAPLVPIMYVDTATDAMLKGLGEQVASMKINVADAALSVLLVFFLVPVFGINGYLITVYVSELFNTVLSVTKLLTIRRVQVKICKWIFAPLLCVVVSTASVLHVFSGFLSTVSGWSLTVLIAATAVLYILLLTLSGVFDKEDRQWLRDAFSSGKDCRHKIRQSHNHHKNSF